MRKLIFLAVLILTSCASTPALKEVQTKVYKTSDDVGVMRYWETENASWVDIPERPYYIVEEYTLTERQLKAYDLDKKIINTAIRYGWAGVDVKGTHIDIYKEFNPWDDFKKSYILRIYKVDK